jgi:tetratricopeptide (TPR) repeat protein
MYSLYRIIPILIVFLLVYFTACKSNASTEPVDNQNEIEKLISDGWNKFIDQDYDGAIEIFREAATKAQEPADQAQIRNGLGWSMAYKAKGNGATDLGYLESIQQFEKAMDNDTTLWDAYAGACLVYNVRNDYQNSVEKGEVVIARQPDYEFKPVKDEAKLLDSRHIRLAIAQSAFYLGDYAKVVLHLDVIDPGVTHTASDPEGLLERIHAVNNQL